jgi:hypothetical protein
VKWMPAHGLPGSHLRGGRAHHLPHLDLPVGILANFGAANMNAGLFRILNQRASGPLPILTPPRIPA